MNKIAQSITIQYSVIAYKQLAKCYAPDFTLVQPVMTDLHGIPSML